MADKKEAETNTKTESIIDKIDNALSDYYQQLNRNDYINSDGTGKFKTYVEDNQFEDEDIKEELEVATGSDCTLTDFDVDNNGNNIFPLNPEIENKEDKIEEIFRILKCMKEKGYYEVPPIPINVTLDMSICVNITQKDIDEAVKKYMSQMECLGTKLNKDKDLKWFFAVSEKCKYPFLTYMVDTYTSDRSIYFEKQQKQLKVSEWAQQNAFMQQLKATYPKIELQLESAIVNYGNRIMKQLLLIPTLKIKDNLKEICEYIASIPAFIQTLLDKLNGGAPFQVDLYIAVREIISHVTDIKDDNDDDEQDEKDELIQQLDPSKDWIGNVQQNLKDFPCAHFERKDDADDERGTENIARMFGRKWADFRTALSTFNDTHNYKDDDSDDSKDGDKIPRIKFDAETYPRNRRFAIFVDRRESKDNEKEVHKDKIIFFQPPKNCNKIYNDRVPEIGFDLLHKCIIPKGVEKNPKNITCETDVCGQLISFMFNVEQKDEIRCYIVWNQQTMRFEGQHLGKVLPYLFVDNEVNSEFIKNGLLKIKKNFDEHMNDEKYGRFCQAMHEFNVPNSDITK